MNDDNTLEDAAWLIAGGIFTAAFGVPLTLWVVHSWPILWAVVK